MDIDIPVNYDFSSSASQAFGNNLKLVDSSPLRYALFSGTVNQDISIDLTDVLLVYNEAISFTTGYVNTDVTGENVTDLTDLLITYNNSTMFISVITP
ncbi:MAG: hypothetical protein IPL53_24250 [Ignavibacteria bacterium]|nr:hypothetical protein [Ignavibacteria bacterium]